MGKVIKILLTLIAIGLIATGLILYFNPFKNKETDKLFKININEYTYEEDNTVNYLKKYSISEFDSFKEDYDNKKLPSIYLTEFLFDGVGMYKAYDLDDFIEEGNDIEVDVVKILVININTTGSIELTGEVTGAMLAVNTNNKKGNINLILNNFKLDTDSKKVPALYVYNKDITNTSAKVTIVTKDKTSNSLEGGKLKKVSLVPSDDLSSYSNIYKTETKDNYDTYTNYYGIYTKEEIKNILFAKVTADNEDLDSGDPYYFYKASGAISSDIDLYFEGKGYLEVKSKNKEGIESKGNLTFSGGTGDYYITSQDDCINTTTDDTEVENARNTLTINVKSLYAIVESDAEEGDAIDSNGELIIDGGLVIALAKTGQDSGIDSSKGTYINGGTILATGDMYDEVKSDSKQRFILLSFTEKMNEDTLITLLDKNDNTIFTYKTDRSYTNLIYSSDSLKDETYYVYKDGAIEGTSSQGLFTTIDSYVKGDQLGYSSKGNAGMMIPGGNNMNPPMNNGENPPEKPEGNNEMTPPDGEPPKEMEEGKRPEGEPGERPEGENNSKATNKEFVVDGIVNLFSGVDLYEEDE